MAADASNIIVGAASITVDSTDVGYTQNGSRIRYEPTMLEVEADQAVGVVRKARITERMYLTLTLLEVTLTNIRIAFMLPASNLVGSTLTLGYNNACWVAEHAIVLVGPGPNCGTRTFTFPTCVPSGGTRELAMLRNEAQAFEVEFEILKDANGNFGSITDS